MPASSRATWCCPPTARPVTSADELKSAVEKSKGHVALLIQRGDAQIFVPVRVG